MAELTSIAFIPDGNRRFAQTSGLPLAAAYLKGTQKAWEVVDWLKEYPSIKVGTFWALALENLRQRTALERKVLFKIFELELDKVRKGSVFEEQRIRLKFIGRTELFPPTIQEKIRKAEDYTADFKDKTMNVAMAYSGQAEMVDAAKSLAQAHAQGIVSLDELNEKTFRRYLYADFVDPDLIVRTGGMHRLSGFLPYQGAYSELYFLDKYWPQFSRADLDEAVSFYSETQRNFGK